MHAPRYAYLHFVESVLAKRFWLVLGYLAPFGGFFVQQPLASSAVLWWKSIYIHIQDYRKLAARRFSNLAPLSFYQAHVVSQSVHDSSLSLELAFSHNPAHSSSELGLSANLLHSFSLCPRQL